jgi:hypothetical protein
VQLVQGAPRDVASRIGQWHLLKLCRRLAAQTGVHAQNAEQQMRIGPHGSDTHGPHGERAQGDAPIDATSLLLRQVREEWKPLPGQVNRRTTTFQPVANPAIEESRFRFVAP